MCIKGAKSQPTIIIPDKNRIPLLKTWVFNTLNESFRWWGFRNTIKLSNTIKCEHQDGSALMFDTQLLHRGSYETGNEERVIFLLEFSVPEKHKISRGPIGTQNGHNSFSFDEGLLNNTCFINLLDKNEF